MSRQSPPMWRKTVSTATLLLALLLTTAVRGAEAGAADEATPAEQERLFEQARRLAAAAAGRIDGILRDGDRAKSYAALREQNKLIVDLIASVPADLRTRVPEAYKEATDAMETLDAYMVAFASTSDPDKAMLNAEKAKNQLAIAQRALERGQTLRERLREEERLAVTGVGAALAPLLTAQRDLAAARAAGEAGGVDRAAPDLWQQFVQTQEQAVRQCDEALRATSVQELTDKASAAGESARRALAQARQATEQAKQSAAKSADAARQNRALPEQGEFATGGDGDFARVGSALVGQKVRFDGVIRNVPGQGAVLVVEGKAGKFTMNVKLDDLDPQTRSRLPMLKKDRDHSVRVYGKVVEMLDEQTAEMVASRLVLD